MKNLITAFLVLSAFTSVKAYTFHAEGIVTVNSQPVFLEKVYLTVYQEYPEEKTYSDWTWTNGLGQYFVYTEVPDEEPLWFNSSGTYTVHWTDCIGRIQSETRTYSLGSGSDIEKDFSCTPHEYVQVQVSTDFMNYSAPNQKYLIEVTTPDFTLLDSGITNADGYDVKRFYISNPGEGNVKTTWLYNCDGENQVINTPFNTTQNNSVLVKHKCDPDNYASLDVQGYLYEHGEKVIGEKIEFTIYDTSGYKHHKYTLETRYDGLYQLGFACYNDFVGEVHFKWFDPCGGNPKYFVRPIHLQGDVGYVVYHNSFKCTYDTPSNNLTSINIGGTIIADETPVQNHQVIIRMVDENDITYLTDTVSSDSSGVYSKSHQIHDNFEGNVYIQWVDVCTGDVETESFYTTNITNDRNIVINLECEVDNPDLTTPVMVRGTVKVNGVRLPQSGVDIFAKDLNGNIVYRNSVSTGPLGKYKHKFELPKYFEGTIYSEWRNYCFGIDERHSDYASNLRYGTNQFVHDYDCEFGKTGIIYGHISGARNGLSEELIDADVFLYQQDANTGLFNKVDSFYIDPATDYPGRYEFEVTYGENYILKAVPYSNPENIPTYYEEAATWQDALIITPFPVVLRNDFYFSLIYVGSQSGSKTIQGNYNGHADLQGVHAVLTNKNTNDRYVAPLDGNGNYEFTNLPHGDYHILLDITDFDITPFDVLLDDNNSSNTTINFEYMANKNGVVASMSQDQLLDFTLAPNPVNSHVTIKLSESTNGTLTIQNAYGRTLKEVTLIDKQELSLDVNEFSAGMYIVTVNSDNKSFNKRFVKQ